MSRGVTFASLLCASLLNHAAFGAGPPCPEPRTVVYAVADLVIPADTRPITVNVGQEMKASRPRKKLQTTQDQLIRKITETVAPGTWGDGKIEYLAKDMSLIVTHTPAVQKKVADALSGLRREQEVNVCLEVRVVRVSEQTFERIGVDFEPKTGAFLDQAGLRDVLGAAQGDRRTNIMQAPKVACFDKQRVNFRLAEDGKNVALSLTPTISADRRFVRLKVRLCQDGAEEEKLKAILADGGSIALPGWSVQRVTAQETAVPVLSRIPYVNRLFKTVGYGRESEKVFLMVTPRVIVQQEVAE
jgi:type II secretory pathway component GspD/PulD (secretin)